MINVVNGIDDEDPRSRPRPRPHIALNTAAGTGVEPEDLRTREDLGHDVLDRIVAPTREAAVGSGAKYILEAAPIDSKPRRQLTGPSLNIDHRVSERAGADEIGGVRKPNASRSSQGASQDHDAGSHGTPRKLREPKHLPKRKG